MGDVSAQELDVLIGEAELRLARINVNLAAIERRREKIDAHPYRLLRNWKLRRESVALEKANRRIRASNSGLLVQLIVATGKRKWEEEAC